MHPDRDTPAENPEHASGEHVGPVDPGTFAYQLFEHVADVHGDADADLFLARVISELLEASPVAREHIADLIIVDLVESLHRHGQPGKEAARMVGVVQREWMNERG